jgi:hypothetical protein
MGVDICERRAELVSEQPKRRSGEPVRTAFGPNRREVLGIVVDVGSSQPQSTQEAWQNWQNAAPAPVTAAPGTQAFQAAAPPAPPAPPTAPAFSTAGPAAGPVTAPPPAPVADAAPPVAAPAAPAEDSGFVTSRHTGGNASFARFVPDSTELENRTASLKPAATALLERPATGVDDGAYEWGETSEEQLAAAVTPDAATASGSATARRARPTGRIAAAVVAIAAAVVGVGFVTGSFGMGGPQQTAQEPITPTTLVSESTPLAPDASIVQSGVLAQGGLGTYPAVSPDEAMVAVLGAVQGQDAQLLRSVMAPSADVGAVSALVAEIDARSAAIDSARNSVVCTTSGATASCDVPPMALGRRVSFSQGPAGWSLTG